MTYFKKWQSSSVLFFFFLIHLILLPLGCSNQQEQKQQEIKIGTILPLTGQLAFFGEGNRKALELFQKGNPDVKFIFEDSKGTAKDGLTAANKLVAQNVKYIITSLSYIVNTVQPVLDQNHILDFTLNMDPRSEEKSLYCLRLYVSFYDEMDKIIELAKAKKVKSVAVLYVNVETMNNAVQNYLRKKLEALNIELYTETYDIGAKDLRPVLMKLSEKKPQIVRFLDFGDRLGIILKQVEEMKLFNSAILVSGVETLLSDFSNFPQGVTSRFLFTLPKLFLDKDNVVVKAYKNTYGKFPSFDTMFAYDIASILVPIIREKGYKNVDQVIKGVINMKTFTGAAARYRINNYGGLSPDIVWAEIRNGKITLISK